MTDELWCLSTGLFGNEDPCNEIDNNAGPQGEEREGDPDQADNRGVGVEMCTNAGTDAPEHASILWAEQPFHVQI